MDPHGIDVLWPHLGSEQASAVWLRAHGSAAELPPAYFADNALTRHLHTTLWFTALEMTSRNHVNAATSKAFRCIAYVADDPWVTAYCTEVEGTYVSIIGNRWLFRLVRICDHLAAALVLRPRAGTPVGDAKPAAPRDEQLTDLLWGRSEVGEADAVAIAASWPAPDREFAGIELGTWAVFYDLVRVVWMHEWAHALCGHLALARAELRLMKLHESSTERAREGTFGSLGFPTSEVMQCLEMHADEFATRYNLGALLDGYDPVGRLSGPKTDLMDRMLHLNTAFCVFAVIWALDEKQNLAADTPATAATHPPVGLRYDRFRGFQREAAARYDPRLMSGVDAFSTIFLSRLTEASGCFGGLASWTPMMFRTPSMKDHERYEQYLMRIGPSLWEALGKRAYLPTVND